MTKTSTRFLSFTLMLMLALVAVVGGGQLSALTPAANATDAQVDLRATLTAPSSGNAGAPFEVIGKVRNVSGDPAGGSTFVFKYEKGTLEAKLECVASGGAVCPNMDDVEHTSPYWYGGSFAGSIPTLPVNGEITLKLTGLYTAINSTSTFSLEATPQSGAEDTDPASNEAVDNTVLTYTSTSVRVTKTQDKLNVNSGESRVYTVTYENTGNAATVIHIKDTYDPVSLSDAEIDEPATVSFSTVCDSSTTASCPAVFNGEIHTKEYRPDGQSITLFESAETPLSDSDTSDTNPYDKRFKHLTLYPGKKLVLKTTVVETIRGCIHGNSRVTVGNKAEANHYRGVEFYPGYAPYLEGYVTNLTQCPSATLTVTKTQDRGIVNSGETRTYTVTYENTSNNDAVVDIADSYVSQAPSWLQYYPYSVDGIQGSILQGSSTVKYSVQCHTSSTATCPAQFDGSEKTEIIDQDNRQTVLFRSNKLPFVQSGYVDAVPSVSIPAGKKLVLKIPVTHTIQGCVENGEYLGVDNSASLGSIAGSGVTIQSVDTDVEGLVKAQECQETTVMVTKTQDKVDVASGEKRKYQVTYENTGDHDAKVRINDSYGWGGVPATSITKVTCDNSSTASCPAADFDGHEDALGFSKWFYDYGNPNSSSSSVNPSSYFNNKQLTIPAGKKLVLNMEITHTMIGCYQETQPFDVLSTANIQPADGSNVRFTAAYSEVRGSIFCNDISSTTTVPNQVLAFGDPLSFSSRFSNDAGQVDVLPFSQVLPQRAVLSPEQAVKAGLVTDPAKAFSFSCFTGSGANGTPQPVACPSDLAYDEAKHAITGTYRQPITADSWFEVHTNTFAGFVAAPSASFDIKSEIGEVRGDVNIPQNNSVDTFELTNTQHTLSAIVTLNRTAPEDINFKIKLYCEFQGDPNSQPAGFVKEVSSSISQNSSSKSLTLHSAYWIHDNCRAEIERGDPPAGYVWDDDAEWEQIKSQIENHIVGDHTWTFPLKIAPAPAPFTPTLPLTGGTAAITYTILGTISGGVALAVAYSRNRVVRRRQLPEVN